jgi:hypothetical protein
MDTLEQRKKIYASFGLAMYHAQCAEQSIMQLLVFFDFFDKRIETNESVEQWERDFDEFGNAGSKKITESLIHAMLELRVIDKEIEELLVLAQIKRSWLADTYFNDRSLDFTHEKGRDKMLEELEDAVSLFNLVEDTLSPITKELCEKYGLTEDVIEGIKYEMYSSSAADFKKSFNMVSIENMLLG